MHRAKQDRWGYEGLLRGLLLGAIFQCAFGFARVAGAGEGNVGISHRTLLDGTVEFQVRGIERSPSGLGLYEVRSNAEFTRLTSFEFSEPGNFYVVRLPAGSPEGVYEVRLYGEDSKEIAISRPPVTPPKDTLKTISATVDRLKSVVSWVPDQTSLIRVNAGLEDGMFIRTLMPWHFSAALESSMSWDFWDEDHIADYRGARGLRVHAVPIPLPSYLVVVGRPLFQAYADLPLFANLNVIEPEFGFEITVDSDKYHRVDSLPGKEIPEIFPGSAIRIQLDQAGREALASRRFEILFFLGGQFFYEETDAVDPYTFLWPSEELGEGFQLLTVNVRSYNIGYGSRTIPVWLSKMSLVEQQPRGAQ